METSKKTCWIGCRCFAPFKKHAEEFLKENCGCSLSEAYNRLQSGLGLINVVDKEAIKDLQTLIGFIRTFVFPFPFNNDSDSYSISKEISKYRNEMKYYQQQLLKGQKPVYLTNIYKCKPDIISVFYIEYNRLPASDGNDIEAIINIKNRYYKDDSKQIKETLKYDGRYNLRTSIDHPVSDSSVIRDSLELMAFVPSGLQDFSDSNKIKNDIKILRGFREWKADIKNRIDKSNKKKTALDYRSLYKEQMEILEDTLSKLQMMDIVSLPEQYATGDSEETDGEKLRPNDVY